MIYIYIYIMYRYMAPEYAASGKLSEKSDVFSYGVVLLELITGRRPLDNAMGDSRSLVDWVIINSFININNMNIK